MKLAFGEPSSSTGELNIDTGTLTGKIILAFALSFFAFYWTRHLFLRIYRYFVNETDTWADFTAKFFKAFTGIILLIASVAMFDNGIPAYVSVLPAIPVIWLAIGRRCVPAEHAERISRGLVDTLALLFFLFLWFISAILLICVIADKNMTVRSVYGAVLISVTVAPLLWLLRHRIMAVYMKMVE